jgi:fumarate hydratase class I
MLKVYSNEIIRVVAELCKNVSYYIREDIFNAWQIARENEESSLAKQIFDLMIKNAFIAWEESMPICQDTGQMVFFVEKGHEVEIIGDSIEEAINKGVEIGGKEGYLRKCIARDILNRNNDGSYAPAIINYIPVHGDKLKISLIPAGCGCEQVSCVEMLTPYDMERSIKDFVIRKVKEAGSKPCPPTIIGIGIGGNLEESARLARKALLPKTNQHNKQFEFLEKELIRQINNLGIGPQGLGGNTTVLDVRIESSSCHRANLPIAILFNCYLGRCKEFTFRDGEKALKEDNKLRQQIKAIAEKIKISNEKFIKISTPLTKETINSLKIGDRVLINGTVYAARDAAHKRMFQLVQQNKPLPFDIRNQIIYYTGPTPPRPGQIIGSAGPTTSLRMDPYTPSLLSAGLKGMIGKGYRSPEVIKAIKENKAIYFSAIGGLGALLSKSIIKSEIVAYEELGTEAIRKLKLKDFPAIVSIDSEGRNLYSSY